MSLPLDGVTSSLSNRRSRPCLPPGTWPISAQVIKAERIDDGDFTRGYDHVVHGTGAHLIWLNRGKESIAVDLKTPEGRSVVRRLVEPAVVVQNLAPGGAERLGFGADELRSTRPELMLANLSGFGRGGPLELRKACDMLIQAEAGLISITRTPETAVKTGIPTADIASGMTAYRRFWPHFSDAGAPVTAQPRHLHARSRPSSGWDTRSTPRCTPGNQPPRMGLSHTAIAPYEAFPTRDGHVLIGVQNDSVWRTLVTNVLDAPALAADFRFATNVQRVRHRDEWNAAVGAPAAASPRPLAHGTHRALLGAGTPASGHLRGRRGTQW